VRDFGVRKSRDLDITDTNTARARLLLSIEQLKQGGLTSTTRPYYHYHLTGGEI
jgi:hypothetical protein